MYERARERAREHLVQTGICHFNRIQKQFFLYMFCLIRMSVCVHYMLYLCVVIMQLQGVCLISG
jgi:hypothetical protein